MEYAVLGRTGLRVSRVGCGGGGIGQVWGPTTEAESVRTIHRALELGVNFFDVAPGYGHGKAEEVLGRALQGRQEQVVVATKVRLAAEEMHDVAGAVRTSVEASLRRLRRDTIDVLHIHNRFTPQRGDLPHSLSADDALGPVLDAYQQMQHTGKTRFIRIGKSNGLLHRPGSSNGLCYRPPLPPGIHLASPPRSAPSAWRRRRTVGPAGQGVGAGQPALKRLVQMLLKLPLGQGVAGYVAKTGKAYICPNTGQEPRYHDQHQGHNPKSMLCIPLLAGNAAIGTLSVGSDTYVAFGRNEQYLLESIAESVVVAIERARLMDSLLALATIAAEADSLPQMLDALVYLTRELMREPICLVHMPPDLVVKSQLVDIADHI